MNFSYNDLATIPWNQKYSEEGEYPPEPKISEMKKFMDIPFEKRDKKFSLFYTWLEIFRLVDAEDVKKVVLDTACGRGQLSQMFFLSGQRVFACDIDNCFVADGSIDFQTADLNTKFPYSDSFFDVVVNSTALHYLNNSEHYFLECKRVLKNGGEVIFSIPNILTYAERINFLRKGYFSEYGDGYLVRKNFIYPGYIFNLLKHLNFEIIRIQGVVPIVNYKIKLINYISWIFMDSKIDEIIKYSNVLIIKAKLNK